MSNVETLRDAMIDGLKDLHSAETQLLKILPKIEEKVTCNKLKALLNVHLEETDMQVNRLKEIEALIDVKLSGKPCLAMEGIVEECKEVLDLESQNEALIDVLLVAAATRIEHYEMAAYVSVIAMARELEEDEIVELLKVTLVEETSANKALWLLCEKELLVKANAENESQFVSRAKSNGVTGKRSRSHAIKLLVTLGLSTMFTMTPSVALAEPHTVTDAKENKAATYESDNSGRNLRDESGDRETADSQTVSSADIKILSEIRRKIVTNNAMSTYGKNIKIIVDDQTVILRGPVKSVEERAWIEEMALQVASDYEVNNQLEIASE